MYLMISLKKLHLNLPPPPDPYPTLQMTRLLLYRLQPIIINLLQLLVQPRVEGFVSLEEIRSDRHGAGDVSFVEMGFFGGFELVPEF